LDGEQMHMRICLFVAASVMAFEDSAVSSLTKTGRLRLGFAVLLAHLILIEQIWRAQLQLNSSLKSPDGINGSSPANMMISQLLALGGEHEHQAYTRRSDR
jgi:hypothetical protein